MSIALRSRLHIGEAANGASDLCSGWHLRERVWNDLALFGLLVLIICRRNAGALHITLIPMCAIWRAATLTAAGCARAPGGTPAMSFRVAR